MGSLGPTGRAFDAAESLLAHRHPRLAGRIIDAALRTRAPTVRADLLGRFTRAQIERGERPIRLVETVAADLAVADRYLDQGRTDQAAAGFAAALALAFHRAVQFDRTDTPLTEDPARFGAPFRSSTTARQVAQPRGRDRIQPAGTEDLAPRRVLLLTHQNQNFIGEIRDHLEAAPRLEVRMVDLAAVPDLKFVNNRITLAKHLLSPDPNLTSRTERVLRPLLEWADTVFVDWCTGAAALLTLVDPGRTRVIVRLHSFEAFSWWPHVVDFSRVDDVVFVSRHLRDLALEVIPALAAAETSIHVVPIGVPTADFDRPKVAAARFTLGLVGYSQIAKDPQWALEVVRLLRAEDPRFRLLLIGAELRLDASPAARAYVGQFWAAVDELELAGAVQRVAQTGDVAAVLAGVGIILSTSVRESYHLGLIEGAASGAVPVVRNWPMFADRANGAHTLYPADWIVTTPADAARRILAATRDRTEWQRLGGQARVRAQAWDRAAVAPLLDDLFKISRHP